MSDIYFTDISIEHKKSVDTQSDLSNCLENIYITIKGMVGDSDDEITLAVLHAIVFPSNLYSDIHEDEYFEIFDSHSHNMCEMYDMLSNNDGIDFDFLADEEKDIVFLEKVIVHKSHRNMGLGEKFFNRALKELKEKFDYFIVLTAFPIDYSGDFPSNENLERETSNAKGDDFNEKQEKLKIWYAKHDFIPLSSKPEDSNILYLLDD
jgi:GNAT superfamily N-acetyltransferase